MLLPTLRYKTFSGRLRRVFFLVLFLISSVVTTAQESLKLWYAQPAKVWEETLPLGNGHLGLTPDGGVHQEKIVLNDITLWSGSPQDANNYQANEYLPQIRQLIMDGKNEEAQDIVNQHFVCEGPGSGGARWGKFQTLGELFLEFDYGRAKSQDVLSGSYRRYLSVDSAIAHTVFTINDVDYKKEYFTSFDDDVAIVKITSSKPGMLNCKIKLSRAERFTTSVQQDELQMYGQLDNGLDGKGMQYMTRLRADVADGILVAGEQHLEVKNASQITIYLAAATDFKGSDFRKSTSRQLGAAMAESYARQRKNHVSNFKSLFDRVELNLGKGKNSELPTNLRLEAFYKHAEDDPALASLFYQFGRYLSISSTRAGLLPPNLQGLWANQINTPWNGDYHLDVNVEMNHWPLEVSNLSELNLPLVELVQDMVPGGERTAKAYYNADGWIAHVITNVWGFTEPGESASWGVANSGSGWLCNNLWNHYAYTLDKEYLKKIYPILKGSAEFYSDALVKDRKSGWLVTSPSVSPENSFYLPNGKSASVTMGPTIDNQIVRDLFNNVIYATKVLKLDPDFRKELTMKLQELPPVGRVSKDGRIMEWIEDYKETDPQHRHISHLWGLYPGDMITPSKTPELAEAAKKTLEVRGDDGPSWAIGYKLLFWARLHDGNRAFKLLRELLKPTLRTDINYGAGGGVYPNLFSAGPPFQIDGNFAAEAGIAEMLIQSHEDFINLLPAIPDTWKSFGEVRGLKAEGNFTLNFKWKNGKVTDLQVFSPKRQKVRIMVNGEMREIKSAKL